MSAPKKKIIKSIENLPKNLLEEIDLQYPNGYESHTTRIHNAKNEPIYVFPLETEDATYLVKIPIVKNSEGNYEEDAPDTEPDSDNIAESEQDFGENNDDDFEEDEPRSGKREASYDPDFDG